MIKQALKKKMEKLAADAQGEIEREILPNLELLRYELELATRLMERAEGTPAFDDWATDVEMLGVMIFQEEERLAQKEAEIERSQAMLAEVEADLARAEAVGVEAGEVLGQAAGEAPGEAPLPAQPAVPAG
jgi:hypothetical protein